MVLATRRVRCTERADNPNRPIPSSRRRLPDSDSRQTLMTSREGTRALTAPSPEYRRDCRSLASTTRLPAAAESQPVAPAAAVSSRQVTGPT